MKKLIITGILLCIAASASAAVINDGLFTMNDGTMVMNIRFTTLKDGKVAIDGMGSSTNGKSCRMGDLASITGNAIVLGGLCSIPMTPTAGGFEIATTPACLHCDQSTHIQGTYKRTMQ